MDINKIDNVESVHSILSKKIDSVIIAQKGGFSMRGYKVFNPDWTCRGFQFEVGKTFEEDVNPKCGDRGFHFCLKASDCFNYYSSDHNNKVAEVLALGEVDCSTEDSKCATNKIQIVREISWNEVQKIVNLGKDCTGVCNTGDSNTGDWNIGNRNTGNRNTGDSNTGDWNKSSFNTGCFMTEEPTIMMFNKPTNWTYRKWLDSDARYLLNCIDKNVVEWVYEPDMSDEEKADNPTYKTTGGYLRVLDESERSQLWWNGLSKRNRDIIKAIPNFDAEIFEQVTGIKVE